MKTPREILLERHRHAEPRLDAVRRKALATLAASGRANQAHLASAQGSGGAVKGAAAMLKKAWLELIWPSRRAWAGMAALWLVVLAANVE